MSQSVSDPRYATSPTTEFVEALSKAAGYLEGAKAGNTLRAYGADWRHFAGWCASQQVRALPAAPETLAAYLAANADRAKVSTLERRLNATVD